jgi:hypothetical protein
MVPAQDSGAVDRKQHCKNKRIERGLGKAVLQVKTLRLVVLGMYENELNHRRQARLRRRRVGFGSPTRYRHPVTGKEV